MIFRTHPSDNRKARGAHSCIIALFFIELGTRRFHVAGCTKHLTSHWVMQQARPLCWSLEGRALTFRYLLYDEDAKCTIAFAQVFAAQLIYIIHTRWIDQGFLSRGRIAGQNFPLRTNFYTVHPTENHLDIAICAGEMNPVGDWVKRV